MSAAVAFDTLKFVRRLRDAGVDEKQAEAFSEAIREVQEVNLNGLVTKQDLEKELSPIRIDIAVLKWMVGIQTVGTIALILKSFVPH